MEQLPESDAVLIRRMQEGDLPAFDVLFEKYRRGILAYAAGMLGDRAQAEDIVQETFVELVQRIDSIDPGRSVSGWLYRVARNRAIDTIRHRKFEVLPGEESVLDRAQVASRTGGDSHAERLDEEERLEQVQAAMGRLPEKDRDLLALRFHGGLKFQEIADLLGRPLGTVLWQVQDCIGKLREYLKKGDTK